MKRKEERERESPSFLANILQMMSALKTGEVSNSRMASIVQRKREKEQRISVDRSGGGL